MAAGTADAVGRTVDALVVLCALAVTLAGCTDGGTPAAPDPDGFEEFGIPADALALRGVVVNEAIVPLVTAWVNVTGPNGFQANLTTNDDGAFGRDGLEPGDYFMTAGKAGFNTMQASTTVVANVANPDAVKIVLTADPASQPYPEQFAIDGYISCSARIMLTAVPAGECQESDYSQEAYTFEDGELARMPDFIQSEMTWESTQSLGDAMSLVSECFSGTASEPDPCPDGNLVVNRSEGSSPLIIEVNRTLVEQFRIGDGATGNPFRLRVFAAGREDTDLIDEDGNNQMLNSTTGGVYPCVAWPAINEGCFRFTGAGVILQQKFTIYTTVFYGYTPPEGWRFTDGSPVPQPE